MSALPGPQTHLEEGPDGPLEVFATGQGEPVTVYAHGLAGSITSTRPFATGVEGSSVFLHQRGHGRSLAPAEGWDYGELAADLRSVADRHGASRAVGLSMGAGALTRVLAETPDRFERVVLIIPAVIDHEREDAALRRMERMAGLVDAGDLDGLVAWLREDQPAAVRDTPAVQAFCEQQARALVGAGAGAALRALPGAHPIEDRAVLADVRVPVLVIGQEEDDAHPAVVARQLGEALGEATVEILPPGGLVWAHRKRVRELVTGFLNA
ncbi:Pimeloyl-ACP methyl ester carboxylesterase [Kytococcus aerolatus]|uniref:Pimeloyl-ACP methyl ester carboxylesterase n=1 Tax=Kytococcus aerolatus TaxID=592308 RepID=A0A212U5V2_9MICO|nr:alpha/beta hydrolase [Kytococcus aerolatus]SNC73645.1 Pimeloyl-ACP methyl ester carboxylesterase [Kytococcus aerolatus]